MKKTILLLAAAVLLVCVPAVAQDELAAQMAEQMTEQMTRELSLTKKQAKKVLALNTGFAKQVLSMTASLGRREGGGHAPGSVMRGRAMRGMPRVPGMTGRGDSTLTPEQRERMRERREAMRHRSDSLRGRVGEPRDTTEAIRQQVEARRRQRRERMAAHEAEARKIRDEYDAALREILTDEQLAKYRNGKHGATSLWPWPKGRARTASVAG